MNNLIEHINLVDGFNLNPIPLEIGQEVTTTKWLMAIQNKVNTIIDDSNNLLSQSNKYTDETYKKFNEKYTELMESIADGSFLQDGVIELSKLSPNFTLNLQKTIMHYLRDIARFVTFGLTDDGYFCAYIPDSWDNIDFSTTEDGRLCLTLLDNEN